MENTNPFKLLNAFTVEDIHFFKGRNTDIDLLFQFVMSGNTILVYGDSGVGKTSLIQCGLPYRLRETGCSIILIRRGKNINTSMKSNLIKALSDSLDPEAENLNSYSVPNLIKRVYLDSFVPVYLIFDQFEDLFNLGDLKEEEDFINELKQIFIQRISCKIIFIIREEFLGRLGEIKNVLPELFSHEMRILPIEIDKVEDEILLNYLSDEIDEECKTGITCIPDAKTISREIRKACQDDSKNIYLPYMQVFLYKLWENALVASKERKDNKIVFTQKLIENTGNIGNVIKDYLEESILKIDQVHESEMWAFLNEFTLSDRIAQPVKIDEIKTASKKTSKFWIEELIKLGIINQLPDEQFELAHFSLVPIIREKKPKYKKEINLNADYKRNPYKGLMSYDDTDEDIYFGRQKVKEELLKKIRSDKLIVVVGSSGSGKSSLIKAGILPELMKEGFVCLSIRPGDQPGSIIEEINSFIETNKNKQTLIYIDQFEELTTRCDDNEQRETFIKCINEKVKQANSNSLSKLKIILSVRADYEYEFIAKFESWKKVKFNVPFFTPEEIIEVITEPACKAGLIFSPDSLIEKMKTEVMSYSGTLPLLSYTLKEMYEEYKASNRNDNLLTEVEYEKSGGIIEGLKKRADEIFNSYSNDVAFQKTIRNLMLRMSSLGINERAAKRVLPQEMDYGNEAENSRVKQVLQKFIDKGLVMEGKNKDGTIAYYEPSHDSLVRNWDLIGNWIELFGKEIIYLQKSLVDAIKSHKIGGPLWDEHANLQLLLQIINSENNWLNKDETNFVLSSIKKREEQIEIKNRNEQEKQLLMQNFLDEERKATRLLEEKLAEEQKTTKLINEKYEEQQKVGILYIEKLEQQKLAEKFRLETQELRITEEKRRTALLKKSYRIGSLLALTFFGFLVYGFYKKDEAEKSVIVEQNKILNINSINRKTDSIKTLKLLSLNNEYLTLHYSDSIQHEELIVKSNSVQDLLLKSKNDLIKYSKLNKLYAFKNQLLTDTAQAYKKLKYNLMIADAKKNLRDEPFYKSSTDLIDNSLKENYISQLISLQYEDNNPSGYQSLRNELNKLSEDLKKAEENPNKELVLMKQFYKSYPNKILDTIGLKIINNNLFYKSKVEESERKDLTAVYRFNGIYKTAISKDKLRFAYATNSGIKRGLIKNDSLIFKEKILNDVAVKVLPGLPKKHSYITSLNYTNENNLIAITNDNKIYQWNSVSSIPTIKNIPVTIEDSIYYLAAISGDGKKLIRDFKDVYIKVFDIENIEKSKARLWKDSFDSKGGYIDNIIPALKGNKALIINSNFRCWVLDIDSGTSKQIGDSLIYSANFTPDGNNIIYETSDSIFMCDLDNNKIGKPVIKNAGKFSRYEIGDLSISEDLKALFIQNRISKNRYFYNFKNNQSNDSLFYRKNRDTLNFKNDIIDNDGIIGFVNGNSILTYNNPVNRKDSLISFFILQKPKHYVDFAAAIDSIKPFLTEKDKKDIGLEKLSESEKYESALQNYNASLNYSLSKIAQKKYLINSKSLLNDLLSLRNDKQEQYLTILKSVDRKIFTIDSNFNAFTSDLKRHISLENDLLEKYSNDTLSYEYQSYKRTLSTDYGSLSFWLVFVDPPEFLKVIEAANAGLAKDSTADFIYTNLALGYLLSGDTIQAKKIYKELKGKDCITLSKKFETAFLEDFSDIERRKVILPKTELYNLVQRIKCFLRNENGCTL